MSSNEYMTLEQAVELMSQRLGTPVTYQQVYRWVRLGTRGRDGTTHKIKHVRAGHRVYTKQQWIDDYMNALAAADDAHFAEKKYVPTPRRHRIKRRRIPAVTKRTHCPTDMERAEAEAEALGI